MLTLIGMAVFVSVAGILFMYIVLSRGPSVPGQATLVLRPGGELHETVPDDVVGQLIGRDAATVRGFVESLRMAKRDPRIRSVVLMPSTLDVPFWGKVQELRDAVLDFRESGKRVIAFLEYGGEREYLPGERRRPRVPAADQPARPDRRGVLRDLPARHARQDRRLSRLRAHRRIQDGGEHVHRAYFTPAHREMSESLNRDMYEQLVRGIAMGRKKTPAEVRALIDQGPFSPEDALRAGLVDDLAYEDQLDDRVPELRTGSEAARRVEGPTTSASIHARWGSARSRASRCCMPSARSCPARAASTRSTATVVGSDTMVEQIRRVA